MTSKELTLPLHSNDQPEPQSRSMPNSMNNQKQAFNLKLSLNSNVPFQLVRSLDTPLKSPSELAIESGSETWVSNVRISGGRKMQRVWKSSPSIKWDSPSIQDQIIESQDQHNGLNVHHQTDNVQDSNASHVNSENTPNGSMISLESQNRLKTPEFTLKPKPNVMEQSGDGKNIENILQSYKSPLKEVQSLNCLSKMKLDPSDFYPVEEIDYGTLDGIVTPDSQSLETEYAYENKRNGWNSEESEHEQEFQKSDRIRKWLSDPHNYPDRLSDEPVEISEDVMGISSYNLETKDSKHISGTEVTSSDGDTKTEMKKCSKTSFYGGFENRSQFSAYMGKFVKRHSVPNNRERPSTPPFPTPLLHSAHQIAKYFHSTRNSSKNQQESQSFKSTSDFGDRLPDMSNFKDISFHYQPKNGNVQNLTPTGFSINFNYKAKSIEKRPKTVSSKSNVSTYFPTSSTSVNKISPVTESLSESVPVPNFMVNFQKCDGGSKHEIRTKDIGVLTDPDYNLETIKPPTPCKATSNVSIVPLVPSETTMETTAPSKHELINEGFYSEASASAPSSAVSDRRRRSRSVRNRPFTDDSEDFRHYEGQNHLDNFERGLFPNTTLFHQSGTESYEPQFYSEGHHQNSFDKRTNSMDVSGATFRNNPYCTCEEMGYRPNSKSDAYLAPYGRGRYWDQLDKVKPCGITKVTAETGINNYNGACTKLSRNRLGSASSSLGSLPTSKTSSKNFIQENIDRIKEMSSKIPKEDRPPLPKAGVSKSQQGKVNAVSKGATKPKIRIKSPQVKKGPNGASAIEKSSSVGVTDPIQVTEKSKPKIRKVKADTKVKTDMKAKQPEVTEVKEVVTMPDFYYMLPTPSERLIIDEVVKADLGAMLGGGRNIITPDASETVIRSGSSTPIKSAGTHWAYAGIKASPNRNPFEDPQFQMIGTARKGSSSLKAKSPGVAKKSVSIAGARESSGPRKTTVNQKAKFQK